MTFLEWCEITFYPGFDPSGLTDDEYYELEDLYNEYEAEELAFVAEEDELW